jgi:hypothetical protein
MAGDLLGLVHTALNLAITAVAVFIQKIFISVVFGRRLPALAGADFLRQNEASDPWGGPRANEPSGRVSSSIPVSPPEMTKPA